MSRRTSTDEFDVLFKLLGNRTRYEILRRIAIEPMFLGQLSRELSVGQQAIIRHLRQMIEQGLLETYEDESIRGPPRKYYRLSKTVRLTIQIAPDGVQVIRVVPTRRKPRTVEEVIRRNYPELQVLITRAQQLPSIPGLLDRKRAAIDLIENLEKKASEVGEVAKHLKIVINYLSETYL